MSPYNPYLCFRQNHILSLKITVAPDKSPATADLIILTLIDSNLVRSSHLSSPTILMSGPVPSMKYTVSVTDVGGVEVVHVNVCTELVCITQ